VSALVTSFAGKLENCWNNAAVMEQMTKVGYLFQVESLLSTHGSEMGMLEDMSVAIKDLAMFSFQIMDSSSFGSNVQFHLLTNDHKKSLRDNFLPFLENRPMKIIIKFPVPTNMLSSLPSDLVQGERIKVFPVMFTQGINEQQTISNTVGTCTLQEGINKENYLLLEKYWNRYKVYYAQQEVCSSSNNIDVEKIQQELEHIGKIIQNSRREKNVEILAKTADFCRSIHGGRATVCKSAKDRTSMSITWEQTRILHKYHGLPKESMQEVMRVMRSAGVRRENAFKNIGVDKYAFNQFQLMLFPEIYRAPKGTEGARVT